MPRPVVGADGAVSAASLVVVQGESELTLRTAGALARCPSALLEARAGRILLNLEDVKVVDAAGLATVLHGTHLAAHRGVRLGVLPSADVVQAALEAGIIDDLPLTGRIRSEPRSIDLACEERSDDGERVAVRAEEFALRRPRWEDLTFFARWAHDPQLRVMVGSDLLHRCRHLGPYHPEFAAAVLHHPTSLTLVVQAMRDQEPPLGYVRLFGIDLGQGFGFLESTLVSRQALRRGWGVAASRLFLAYAHDVLGIRRIEAKVYDYNRLSINALRRNGFIQEGVLRRAVIHHGVYSDILVFGILEDELREQRKKEAVPYLGLWGALGDVARPAAFRKPAS
jgi:RimJ/RimL family protein N-acetyltransferase/anti-anti-sigma regulatory factor